MKILTLLILLTLSTLSFAQDVEIDSAQIACLGYSHNIYTYGVELVIKNNSKNNISFISKTNGAVIADQIQGEPTEITIYHAERLSKNLIPIIPASEKLEVIELYPGEVAIIEAQVSIKKLIEYAFILFNSPNAYGLRFHNWMGVVKSDKLMVHGVGSCKP